VPRSVTLHTHVSSKPKHRLTIGVTARGTTCNTRLKLSFRRFFRTLHDSNALFLRVDHHDEEHTPTTWSEYQSLMADAGTYPDISFLHAAARFNRCQFILFLLDDKIPARSVLFSANSTQHVNWGATLTHNSNSAHFFPYFFRAPLLLEPPASFALRDDKLHALYN
jgi:hypothetical protein